MIKKLKDCFASAIKDEKKGKKTRASPTRDKRKK